MVLRDYVSAIHSVVMLILLGMISAALMGRHLHTNVINVKVMIHKHDTAV